MQEGKTEAPCLLIYQLSCAPWNLATEKLRAVTGAGDKVRKWVRNKGILPTRASNMSASTATRGGHKFAISERGDFKSSSIVSFRNYLVLYIDLI